MKEIYLIIVNDRDSIETSNIIVQSHEELARVISSLNESQYIIELKTLYDEVYTFKEYMKEKEDKNLKDLNYGNA